MSTSVRRLDILLRLVAAAILLQTLFFKFTGAEESVYIFQTLGAEPWGRIGSGLAELAASILLLVPATAAVGGTLGVGLMSGALLSHATTVGIEVRGDGGLLFALAIVVWLASAATAWIHRRSLPIVGSRLAPRTAGSLL
jgi:hypothetical protein